MLYFSDSLDKALATLQFKHDPLIEDFLYAKTINMISAEPGAGKSLIALQVAISLSSGTPLFETFKIPAPVPVYYMQLEGSCDETFERMKHMQSDSLPINSTNLCLDDQPGINALQEASIKRLEARIASWGKTPSLIIIDPIYMAVAGGLSKDELASAFAQFVVALKDTYNCSVLMIHHTHRATYSKDGKKIEEDDPFYGSQWLKAVVDVAWYMTSNDEGVLLDNKKARSGNVLKKIPLGYRPESMTCFFNTSDATADARTRVIAFLRQCKERNITTTFKEICSATGVSSAWTRHLQQDTSLLDHVTFRKSPGHKTIWIPK